MGVIGAKEAFAEMSQEINSQLNMMKMHNMKFGDDLIRGSAMGQDYAIKTGEAVYLDPITITPND